MVNNYFLISRKDRWGLTWQGYFFILFCIILVIWLFFRNIYSILAPVERVESKILVVEGSVNDYVLVDAIREFNKGKYQLLITTGTPLEYGYFLSQYKNTAEVTGHSLLRLGFDSSKLVMLASDEVINDRTYNAASKLKRFIQKNNIKISSINLISQSVHGGRSRLLFREALGDSIKVGIISIQSMYYNGRNWWHSSKGFREVMNETFGYFYVSFFFRPYKTQNGEK